MPLPPCFLSLSLLFLSPLQISYQKSLLLCGWGHFPLKHFIWTQSPTSILMPVPGGRMRRSARREGENEKRDITIPTQGHGRILTTTAGAVTGKREEKLYLEGEQRHKGRRKKRKPGILHFLSSPLFIAIEAVSLFHLQPVAKLHTPGVCHLWSWLS